MWEHIFATGELSMMMIYLGSDVEEVVEDHLRGFG